MNIFKSKNIFFILPLLTLGMFSCSSKMMSPGASPEPSLHGFRPLPPPDPKLSKHLGEIVQEAGLDQMTPASENPDNEDEWSSICLVDISDINNPVVAGWKEDNFIYPASAYKLYVLGEAVRQIVAGEISLDGEIIVKEHNVRRGDRIEPGEKIAVAKILRLMMMYSDNSASNEAIDLVDRENASELLRKLGCEGSEVTRKFLPRSKEDEGYADVRSTTSNALHFATYLWAIETGAIGGGRGRGLAKAFMSMRQTGKDRMEAGIPQSATIYSKTGTWNIFTAEAALIEDGEMKYILCAIVPMRSEEANPKIAELSRRVYELIRKRNKL